MLSLAQRCSQVMEQCCSTVTPALLVPGLRGSTLVYRLLAQSQFCHDSRIVVVGCWTLMWCTGKQATLDSPLFDSTWWHYILLFSLIRPCHFYRERVQTENQFGTWEHMLPPQENNILNKKFGTKIWHAHLRHSMCLRQVSRKIDILWYEER